MESDERRRRGGGGGGGALILNRQRTSQPLNEPFNRLHRRLPTAVARELQRRVTDGDSLAAQGGHNLNLAALACDAKPLCTARGGVSRRLVLEHCLEIANIAASNLRVRERREEHRHSNLARLAVLQRA